MVSALTALVLAGHIAVAPTFTTIRAAKNSIAPTSIVQIPAGDVLVSDYSHIYRLHKGKLKRLPDPDVPKFVPAGIAYSHGRVYVANYLGGDVLVLNYPTMRLVRRITGFVGPEGIWTDGMNIDVADFDGGTITRWNTTGKVWSTPVSEAHAVVESAGSVYATSLRDRTLVRLNAATGAITATTGGPGTEPGRMLWPTGLAVKGKNIAVIDAHLGRITTYTPNLDLISVVGANGPGVDLFNFPYALTATKTGWLIADTYKRRVVTIEHAALINQTTFGPVPAGVGLPVATPVSSPSGFQYNDYSFGRPALPLLELLGISTSDQLTEGYGGFVATDSSGTVTHVVQTYDQARVAYTYETWCVQQGDLVIVGSPQQTAALMFNTATWEWGWVRVPPDTWSGRLTDGRPLVFPGQAARTEAFRWLTIDSARSEMMQVAAKNYLASPDLSVYLRQTAGTYYVTLPEVLSVRWLDAHR